MKIKDPVKVVGLFLPLPVLSAIAGLWFWFWLWIAILACLGIAELASYKITGFSISEQFWANERYEIKVMMAGAWMAFAIYLTLHLLWRW